MNAPEPQTRPHRPSAHRRWMGRILGETYHHYSNIWPEKLGRLKTLLLKLFFSGIRLEDYQINTLKGLPEDAILIFATKFSCLFSFLFAYTRYGHLGLRFPQIGLGCRSWIWPPLAQLARVFLANVDSLLVHRRRPDPHSDGHLRNEFLKGKTGFLALIGKDRPRPFWGKPAVDPLEFLLDLQKTADRPVLIVPQLMFFGRKPRRSQPTVVDMLFGPEDEPGRLRRLAALFKNPGNVFVEISPPVDLRRFIERTDINPHSSAYQAALLRGEILQQINHHRQSITGPVLKSRNELMESILNSERLQQFMQAYAEDHHRPLQEVRAKVSGYLSEIAADINPNWILFYSGIIGWILRTMYDGVVLNPEEIAAIKRVSLQGSVVFIPSHKSHVDYLILSYVLYINDMPCPLVAAGRNLSFWPIGALFRRGGAFFIRRSFKGAVLYSRAFSEYVHKILEEGYNVEQFIEGGRSRTGKLLMPKLGLLSILLNAYKSGACRDMIFVPVSIGYDRVLEERSYLAEIEGEQKQAESFLQFIQVPKFLRKRYGKIYLQLGEPISMKEIDERGNPSPADVNGRELNDLCRSLGHRISYAINRKSVVTPHALAATAILTSAKDRFTFDELLESTDVYLNNLYSVQARLADTLIMDHRRALAHAMESYCQRKIVEAADGDRLEPGAGASFIRIESKRPSLEYYKNTCVAFFVPAAFTAMSILQKDAFQFSVSDLHREYEFLQKLFELEFVFDSETPAAYPLLQTLKTFMDEAILSPHPELPDAYNLTSAGYRKLKLFAALLKTLLESYWVVLSTLAQTPYGDGQSKELSKKISARGSRMYRRKEIENREALSKVSFDNAAAFFTSRGIKGSEDQDRIAAYAAAIQRALRHLKS